jgi:hypothetical protein
VIIEVDWNYEMKNLIVIAIIGCFLSVPSRADERYNHREEHYQRHQRYEHYRHDRYRHEQYYRPNYYQGYR